MGVNVSLVGGAAEPADGLGSVSLDAAAFCVCDPEVGLCLGESLVCRESYQRNGFGSVLGDTAADSSGRPVVALRVLSGSVD